MTPKADFIFRRAKVEDIQVVRQLIKEYAEIYEIYGNPEVSIDDFTRDAGLNGGTEYFHPYLLELKNADNKTPTPIGFAVCIIYWSSSVGKTYFLENLYVKSEYRNIGAGKHILCEIAAIVKDMGYKRLDFHVAASNPAIEFYKNLGAKLVGSHHFRMEENTIKEVAEQ